MRFCRAQQIADLRELMTGPVPKATFAGRVLTGAAVLGEDFATDVARHYQVMESAHSSYVSQLLMLHQGKVGSST